MTRRGRLSRSAAAFEMGVRLGHDGGRYAAHDPDCQLVDKDHSGPHHVRPGHPKAIRPHDLIHAVDCWCDPLGLVSDTTPPQVPPKVGP